MHRVTGDLDSYIARMRDAGVAVGRAFPPMLAYNRVSIGLPAEMEVWTRAITSLRGQGLV
jgi:histidinol-phosphate aminotransferase